MNWACTLRRWNLMEVKGYASLIDGEPQTWTSSNKNKLCSLNYLDYNLYLIIFYTSHSTYIIFPSINMCTSSDALILYLHLENNLKWGRKNMFIFFSRLFPYKQFPPTLRYHFRQYVSPHCLKCIYLTILILFDSKDIFIKQCKSVTFSLVIKDVCIYC